ncbi:class I adenylate-forming enzyme family protein [Methanoregula sp.]|uniref:class I adenylate-forming enzyme family protein n=1 Tax=Methanoregula sp. TaxID=2052170 RepID=UPI002C1D40C6|nr:class I adenylate-forming enzyme family protein [Methanoregula sp.]HVP96419.1 class I adenylate-forming enzyme family protein [Methanoregula sp.]
MSNVTTLLEARSVPEAKAALVCPSRNRTYSYRELRDEMNRIGAGLAGLGIRKGDRVCIYLDSSPEYLISYFAIWRIGAVAVPTNIVYQADELLHVVSDAGARAIITDTQGVRVVAEVRKNTPSLAYVICVTEPDQEPGGSGFVVWSSFPPTPASLRAENCGMDDLCHIQYTAGTTGKPKGAMLTHGNWMTALDAEREALRLRPDDVYLGIYPMGHVGLSWGLAVLRAGGTFVMMERFNPTDYLTLAERYKVTVLAGMPPVIHTLVHGEPGTGEALSTARVIISGGGQLLPSVWEAFDRRFHIPVANSYGLSETIVIGSGTTTLPEYPALTRNYQSVGVAVGYTEVRIVDADDPGKELAAGQTGEIALRGPSVARGYWNLPEATAAVFQADGWFLTGDIGYLDAEGILYITDRKKDMIIMSGWKIYPTEVENVIVQHPAVADVAVFGIPDERRGESPVAAVVLKAGAVLTEQELESFCRTHLAGYKIPRKLLIVDDLPRVHGWKLLRRTLREKFGKTIV